MKLIVKIFLISSLLVIAACSEAETISFESSEAIEVRNEPGTDDSIDLDEFEKEMEEMDSEFEDEIEDEIKKKMEEMDSDLMDSDEDAVEKMMKEYDAELEKMNEESELELEKMMEESEPLDVELIEFFMAYDVPGIENILDLSWPREVEAMNGTITIDEKPERILTISTGHDEMIFGFANLNNIVGVTSFSQSPGGNIYELTKDMPTITSEIETIVAQNPDIVFADPYANANLMQSLVDLGITVVQTNLNNTNDGRINDIIFAAYVLDELEGARMLINAIDSVVSYIYNTPINSDEYNVLSVTYYDAYWAAGEGSTEGSIIELAGFINSAAEEGVVSNNMITKESLIAMMPHHIVIPQSVEWGGQDFYDTLMSDESFSSIPAVKNESVHMVNTSHFTTLSHFNILGAIDLLEILPGERMGLNEFEKPILKACYQCFGD